MAHLLLYEIADEYINIPDREGISARSWILQLLLCHAAEIDDFDLAELLLKGRVACNQPGEHGRSAIYYAAVNGNAQLMELLLFSGTPSMQS